ncbi:MAG TPA: RNA polymerase sigma factor, partial [bacterium]|nr:RNA polymerase sigma factor [bacterium]
VFMKLFQSIDSFRGESDIRTYLYRMAVNRSIDLIRSRRVREEKMGKIEVKTVQESHLEPKFAEIIEKLDEKHRVVLLLSEVAGFSYREIAEALDTKVGTVKSRVNRAITELRKIYAKEGLL